MIALRGMTPDEFDEFLSLTRAERIDDMVRIGLGTEQDVAAATDQAIAEVFPDGSAGDNLLFTVVDDDRPVGYLWLRDVPEATVRCFSVWWVYVRPSERRRGIGRATMLLAEDEAKARGGVELRLNVFAHNPNARALYDSIGYEPTNTQMRKSLSDGAPARPDL